jgi:peroxiredoxin Q/BCP
MIEVGKKAPAFKVEDQDEKTATLAQYAGQWVVLYFYPRDDTPGCTVEACDFTKGIRGFANLKAVVLGCSGDSPASHRKFIEKFKLKLRLLSDPEHKLMQKYGAGTEDAAAEDDRRIARPSDRPAGKDRAPLNQVVARHAEKVAEKLAELQGAAQS